MQLVCSFVLSRIDYCKGTLAGLPATHIARLHRITNTIQTRIDYNLATLRNIDDSLLQDLSSRLDIYQPSRSLRSSNDRLLMVSRWKLKSFRYRSFTYQGPVVWNSLPTVLKFSSSLESFQSKLKTNLFKKSYSLSCHVMSCHVMSCHVMSCHVMSCHVMSCHVMSCHVMSCHVMAWHGMACHVIV